MRPATTLALALLLTTLPLATVATSFTSVPAPTVPDQGSHLILHGRSPDSTSTRSTILSVDTPDGELVMAAEIAYGSLWISDGRDGDGSLRFFKAPATSIPHGRIQQHEQLFEVTLDGDHYTISVDQFPPVTARTVLTATTGQLSADLQAYLSSQERQGVRSPAISSVRWTSAPHATLHTFTSGPDANGWTTVDPSGEAIILHDDRFGDRSRGHLEIESTHLPTVRYIQTPVTGFDGRYVAEAAAFPDTALFPHPQALVAGISGPEVDDPSVHWAVVLDRAPASTDDLNTLIDDWTLYFVGPNGERTQIGDNWFDFAYHRVRLHVDEPADRIDVVVDDATQAFRFQGLGIGTSESIATGDVVADPVLPLRPLDVGSVIYDNVAVYPTTT